MGATITHITKRVRRRTGATKLVVTIHPADGSWSESIELKELGFGGVSYRIELVRLFGVLALRAADIRLMKPRKGGSR